MLETITLRKNDKYLRIKDSWRMGSTGGSFVDPTVHMGIGGVVRNNRGQWRLGFERRSFMPDILSSELRAIYEGFLIASMYNFNQATIYSDCISAVRLLCNNIGNSDKYISVLSECRKLWMTLLGVKIEHCSRKDNRVADVIAKNCRYTDSRCNVTRVSPFPWLL